MTKASIPRGYRGIVCFPRSQTVEFSDFLVIVGLKRVPPPSQSSGHLASRLLHPCIPDQTQQRGHCVIFLRRTWSLISCNPSLRQERVGAGLRNPSVPVNFGLILLSTRWMSGISPTSLITDYLLSSRKEIVTWQRE